jgi:hypothetical protein
MAPWLKTSRKQNLQMTIKGRGNVFTEDKVVFILKITPQMSILDSRIIFHAFVTFFRQSTPENLLVYQ